jgi:hypothetical protein
VPVERVDVVIEGIRSELEPREREVPA